MSIFALCLLQHKGNLKINTMSLIQQVSVRATLIQMRVGQTITIPTELRSFSYIRTCAATLNMEFDRKYSVHLNRETRQYEVTRNS